MSERFNAPETNEEKTPAEKVEEILDNDTNKTHITEDGRRLNEYGEDDGAYAEDDI